MQKLIATLAAGAAAVGVVATATTATAEPPERTTIVDTVLAVSGGSGYDDVNDFDILREAVVATESVNLLDGRRQLTVFAPTDDAFVALANALPGESVESEEDAFTKLATTLGVDAIRDVLEYHIAPGERFSGDVVPAERIRTLSGGFLTKDAGSITFDQGAPAPASILVDAGLFDIDVDNGVIHAIDAVLVP
ncbi:MAG: fasciclin domain-containing protein [Actinomycetota bacterium]